MVSRHQMEEVNRISNLDINKVDVEASKELLLFIENDGNLYRQMTQSIIKNLERKKVKGIYNHKLAILAFMNLVDEGAKRYESGGLRSEKIPNFFNKDTRIVVAKNLVDEFESGGLQ